ncbi:MAG: zinc-dependent metalloprotease [Myxococcota bacterium]|nr:zinc-dependent metalloprotease [Myxococcota bacterium]
MQTVRKANWILAMSAAMLVMGFGCGEEVGDVDRIQPHYVKKSNLEGEWYFRQTVVDRPPNYLYLFTGIENSLEKIRWEVRESQLIAYRIHAAVRGIDDDETLPGAEFKGDPVAVYSIISHFDIIRDFDRNSGQQSNVLVENASLKPWFEREYMRVDWTSNTLSGPVDIGGYFSIAGLGKTHAYHPRDTEPYNPDRLQLDDDRIFFTNYYIVNDGGYSCFNSFGWGMFGGFDNCGPVEVKIRNAFSRIDPEEVRQFEARKYDDRTVLNDDGGEPINYVTVTAGDDGQMIDVACTEDVISALSPEITIEDCKPLSWNDFSRFGYFRSQRYGYDRRVGGGNDALEEFYANHHQVWKKTVDGAGNRIPLTERELRPVVYYLNPNFPDNLKDTAAKIGDDWNNAFMEMAMAATGRSAEEIAGQLAADTDPNALFLAADTNKAGALFQVRENNCSARGVEAYLTRNPSMSLVSLEAAGGELLPGNIERVCSALNYFSKEKSRSETVEIFEWQQMGDLRYSYIWWVNEAQPNGPLGYGPSSADIESGRIISGNAHVYGAALDSYARSAADVVRTLNGDLDVHELLDGHSYMQWINSGTSVADQPAMPSDEMQAEISRRIGSDNMDGYRSFRNGDGSMDKAAVFRHMRDRLRNTSATDPIQAALNVPEGYAQSRFGELAQNTKSRAPLLTHANLKLVAPLFNWVPGEDVPAEMEEAALDLAINPHRHHEEMHEHQKFFSERNVYLGDFIDDSVIGMALELRGLPAEEVYQRLRREIFEAVMLHEIGHTVGLRHNFEASTDALNYQDDFWQIREQFPEEEWNQARLPEYRYTSIMDYGSRFNSDMKGLGKYDYAAIKYLYGGQIEVFDDSVPVPGRLDLEMDLASYTRLPEMLGGASENFTKRRNRKAADVMEEKRLGVLENARLLVENRARPTSEFYIERTVPYAFCTDQFNGDLNCKTWDEGATQTEAVQAAIQRYWNYYLFNSFRRGRNENSFIRSFTSSQSRVMDYLMYPWQFYYFYDAYPVDLRDDLLQAAMLGLNFINQVLGTPEPGRYCQYTNELYLPADVFNRQTQLDCNSINVGLGAGRDLYFQFSDEHIFRWNSIGSFFDKQTMMQALFINGTRFFRIRDDSDSRAFNINYYRVFREEMLKLTRDMVMSTMMNWTYIDGNPSFVQDTVFGSLVVDGALSPQLLVDPARFATSSRASTAAAPKLYTQIPYNIATRSLIYNAITNSSPYDQVTDFIEYITVLELGSGDDRVVEGGTDMAVFVHPMTGQTYAATQTQDGRSIAHELATLAADYVTAEWEPARQAYEADPTNENFERIFERIDRQLQEFVEMLDYMRQLRSDFDLANRR